MPQLSIGNVPEGVAEAYSKFSSPISFLENHPARAYKWAEITGYKDPKHPGWVEEKYGGMVRIGMEMMFEEQVGLMALDPALQHIGKDKILFMRPKALKEAIDSTAVSPWVKYALPLITRLLPVLYGESLVQIQAIPHPSYRIFFFDWNYGTAVAPTQVGHRIDDITKFNRFYGGWGYGTTPFTGDGATVNFDLESAGVNASGVKVYINGSASAIAFSISAGAGAGGVDRLVFNSAPADGAKIVATYGTYAEGATPRDIDVSMSQRDVKVSDQALRIGWTKQSEQDFLSVHGIGIEPTLTGVMTWEAMAEIDLNIILFLFYWAGMAGAGNVNWSSSGYLPGDTDSASRLAYDQTLGYSLIQADDLIWKASNGRARANWMIAGTDASQKLRQLASFTAVSPGNPGGAGGQANGPDAGGPNAMSIERRTRIGTVGNTQTVYLDPRVPTNKILLGYKSPNPFHLQAAYCPYRMFHYTGTLEDPSANHKFKKGVLNRAAMEMVNSFGFSTVTIT